jgi:hypothetical protein
LDIAKTSEMNVFIKITAKKLSAQKLYFFKIPKWYLDKRNIVFRPISLILDEINDSYLMKDAFDNKVWIPKKMIQSELIEN